ncbi:hypothetical protein [Paraburkholderia terrae]|uniref:hypothetical protein n=1 Tax=Paraburkholderia terrae TaxID=311230 RepID=UPI002048AEC1|nr:hypothetical protein [Paraburkholderia terrae]BDC37903.1 hypothetical protein PTKU15_12000 [Paraburkholderia terrae]
MNTSMKLLVVHQARECPAAAITYDNCFASYCRAVLGRFHTHLTTAQSIELREAFKVHVDKLYAESPYRIAAEKLKELASDKLDAQLAERAAKIETEDKDAEQ